jgi:hypothetical protein
MARNPAHSRRCDKLSAMIWESYLWKADLAKRAHWLLGKKNQHRWPESACVRVEQCVMIGCYCVRKLIEAKKLTDVTARRQLALTRYAARGKRVHHMNWHKLDELYDLDDPDKTRRPLLFVCNQLIHSFVFVNCFDDDRGLDSLMFASDRDRNEALFQLSIDDLANAFIAVSEDEVSETRMTWNPRKQDYDVTQC